MRIFAEVLGSVTNSIRFIVGLVVFCILGLGLMFTAGASYIAPKAMDTVVDRAESISEKALEAEKARIRDVQLGAEGWGYSDQPVSGDGYASEAHDAGDGQFGSDGGGWAD